MRKCETEKKLEEYMKKEYRMELYGDPVEGGYTVSFPELPGCLTCGETVDEAINNAKDAKETWLIAALEDNYPIPEPERDTSEYSGQFKLRLPKSLHKLLAMKSKEEGISMNQYCVYLLAKSVK